jgi:glycosyltransferase involved in cell wall biosynthesis
MLDRFIIALAMLRRVSGRNLTKLKIVGTGAMIRKYRELVDRLYISGIVSFEGYLERGELVSTLVTADYSIIGRPSINNPWNVASVRTTLYEYMAAGLPIFAFGPKKSYIKTLLDVNKCGYYVQYDDPLDITENLEKFLGLLKSFDRKTIHERSYRYNWPTLAKQFTEIIRSI